MTTQADTKKTYVLDGTLLEACSCGGPCPCWVGDDPDGGRCDSVNAYHIDRGRVGGVDVSNLSFVQVNQIPGNVLAGNWRAIFYLDDKASPAQQEALLMAFGGRLGGPLADVAGLVGERVAVHSVPIEHRVEGGKGTRLVVAAWAIAVLAALTNRGYLIDHHYLLEESQLPWLVALVVFLACWQLMTVGMMLPSSMPMVYMIVHAGRQQGRPLAVTGAFLV